MRLGDIFFAIPVAITMTVIIVILSWVAWELFVGLWPMSLLSIPLCVWLVGSIWWFGRWQ